MQIIIRETIVGEVRKKHSNDITFRVNDHDVTFFSEVEDSARVRRALPREE